MAKGLAMPIRPNPSGGLLTVEGNDNDHKIIALALASDENDNAFQQKIGVGKDVIFNIEDQLSRTRVLIRLRRVFERFEALNRYRLVEDSIQWVGRYEDPTIPEGEVQLRFQYTSLENTDPRSFSQRFSAAGDGAGGRSF